MGKFYALCEFLALPSLEENYGTVVDEASCVSQPVDAPDQLGAGLDLVAL